MVQQPPHAEALVVGFLPRFHDEHDVAERNDARADKGRERENVRDRLSLHVERSPPIEVVAHRAVASLGRERRLFHSAGSPAGTTSAWL